MHKDMIPGVGLSRAKCSELQETRWERPSQPPRHGNVLRAFDLICWVE
jgi:hypothetical protein